VLKNLEDGKTNPIHIIKLVGVAIKCVAAYYRHGGGVEGVKDSLAATTTKQ